MGVEPTGAGVTDAHAVLKTGEATGPHPPPSGVCTSAGSLAWGAGGPGGITTPLSLARERDWG